MNIVGIQESFIDYPDNLSVIVFTRTCKLDCVNCHNKYRLLKESTISEDRIFKYIDEAAPLTNHIVISGGEPTDESDLIKFVKKLKDRNLFIKLDTNGTNPDVLEQVLPYLSVVAMDVKENINKYERYKRVCRSLTFQQFNNIQLSLEMLSEWSKSENHTLILRTTLLDDMINSDDVKSSLSIYNYDNYVVNDKIVKLGVN